MLGNFLETICWEIFWKLYAGNILMETIWWEIRVDTSEGVILAKCCGALLWSASTPTAPQVILERGNAKALLEASKVIASMRRGWWGAQLPERSEALSGNSEIHA